MAEILSIRRKTLSNPSKTILNKYVRRMFLPLFVNTNWNQQNDEEGDKSDYDSNDNSKTEP